MIKASPREPTDELASCVLWLLGCEGANCYGVLVHTRVQRVLRERASEGVLSYPRVGQLAAREYPAWKCRLSTIEHPNRNEVDHCIPDTLRWRLGIGHRGRRDSLGRITPPRSLCPSALVLRD
jgi:hypothetical protein